MDELALFQANFGDYAFQKEFRGTVSRQQLSELLSGASSVLENKLYGYSEIDAQKIREFAKAQIGKIKTVRDLVAVLQETKQGKITAAIAPFCKDPRDPEYLVSKKCAPLSEIGFSYYLYLLFSAAFPSKLPAAQKLSLKKEARLVANSAEWKIVKKVDFTIAKKSEAFVSLSNILSSMHRKQADVTGVSKEAAEFLSRFPERKSFGKIAGMLSAALEEKKFDGKTQEQQKLFAVKIFDYAGFNPFCSVATLNAVYPEYKVPKPKGRMKKA